VATVDGAAQDVIHPADWLRIPVEVRPRVGATLAAGLTDETDSNRADHNVLVERSRHCDMNGIHSCFPTPMPAGNIDPTLMGPALRGLVFRRIDIEESRQIAMAVFKISRLDIHHQRGPIPLSLFLPHDVEHEPAGRRSKNIPCHGTPILSGRA
jgi:hypothetical protein